jgi:hypothetical protein
VKADLRRGLAGAFTTLSCISAVIAFTPNRELLLSILVDVPNPRLTLLYLFSSSTVQTLQISLSASQMRLHIEQVLRRGYSALACRFHLPLGQYFAIFFWLNFF